MLKIAIASACLLAATATLAGAKPDANPAFKTSTNIECDSNAKGGCATENVTFQCNSSPTGQCYFVVMATDCSGQDASGNVDEVCTTRKLNQFSLKPGESKQEIALPANFIHCTDVAPVAGLQACMAKPVRH